ncbi:MAG: biopolymer transporter ExbD [Opitutaceae bacterium]|nr:biopolymer transporter ExbD [Opitutaceae bacterium]
MAKRRLLFSNEGNQKDEINISPLIDVVFILLIFFIVTTVFVEETGVNVQRPQAVSAVDLEKNSILIAITEEGRVVYGGEEIGLRGVRGVVQRLLKKEDMPVIVQADATVSIDLYTKVHDEAALAGATSINLATTKGNRE